jgi:PIN domain nuclease of toxin-antitoxin system
LAQDGPWVLDASALLAVMQAETGADKVEARIEQACISAVNLSEAVAKLAERGISEDFISTSLAGLELDVRPFDHEQAQSAGFLRVATRSLGLSLGDRACLALARQLNCTALTTDSVWAGLDIGVKVEVIR